MAEKTSKGASPFYPGQPVPVELFAGRSAEIQRVLQRGAAQVKDGKPVSVWIQGDYGIGKSSLAKLILFRAEREYDLHGIYANLGGVRSIDDLATSVLEATIRSGILNPTRSERVRGWLSKYLGNQGALGVSINFEALRHDMPTLNTPYGMLGFLGEADERMRDGEEHGLVLVLDEINGIADTPEFAHFIKGLVDANAVGDEPLPLLLVICGTEDRRRAMVRAHQPVERIFDVVQINPMTWLETGAFFEKAFASVGMSVSERALTMMRHFSGGLPKVMHEIGDAAFWSDEDSEVDYDDATYAVRAAAMAIGRKYLDQQVYEALRSRDYHAILAKISRLESSQFTRSELREAIDVEERPKLDNFIRRMERLGVIEKGVNRGEYRFPQPTTWLYVVMRGAGSDDRVEET